MNTLRPPSTRKSGANAREAPSVGTSVLPQNVTLARVVFFVSPERPKGERNAKAAPTAVPERSGDFVEPTRRSGRLSLLRSTRPRRTRPNAPPGAAPRSRSAAELSLSSAGHDARPGTRRTAPAPEAPSERPGAPAHKSPHPSRSTSPAGAAENPRRPPACVPKTVVFAS